MRTGCFAVMSGVALLAAAPLEAQNKFAIEPYVGVYVTDDDGAFVGNRLELEPRPPAPPVPEARVSTSAGILFGARASWEIRPGWTLEGAYGHASYATEITVDVSTVVDPDGGEETFELTEHGAHLYYGGVRYDVLRGSVRPFVAAGVGGVTISSDLEVFGPFGDLDSVTDPLVSMGGGLVIDVAPRTRIRGDLRDQIHFCSEGSGLCEDGGALHNVEVSGGVEITF